MRPSSRVAEVQLEIRFKLRDCRPSGRWSVKRTTLRRIELFVRLRELRLPVTRRNRSSVLHGNPKYVALLPSELSLIGNNLIDVGEGCVPHQSGPLPQHPVIGHSPFPLSALWRERRPNLRRLAPSPNINSVRSIARELRRPSTRVVDVQMEIRL
jgi:hypothetical protein